MTDVSLASQIDSTYRAALTRGEKAGAYFAAVDVYLSRYPQLSEVQAGIEVANILLANAPQDGGV